LLKATGFLIVLILLCIVNEARLYIKSKEKKSIEYWIFRISFYIYLMMLINVAFFPIPIQKEVISVLKETNSNAKAVNITPFHSIIQTVKTNPSIELKLLQLIGNIVLILPITFYIPLVYNRVNNLKKALILSIIIAILIEMMQFVIGRVIGYYYRIIDIDDIILNVFGGIVGYICMLPVKKIILKKININL
jgi:glycopeptide antibiotics resistance protein